MSSVSKSIFVLEEKTSEILYDYIGLVFTDKKNPIKKTITTRRRVNSPCKSTKIKSPNEIMTLKYDAATASG